MRGLRLPTAALLAIAVIAAAVFLANHAPEGENRSTRNSGQSRAMSPGADNEASARTPAADSPTGVSPYFARVPVSAKGLTDDAFDALWQAEDRDLYRREWTAPEIIERPLGPQKNAQPAFDAEPDGLVYESDLGPDRLGFDTLPYAGVAAGDLNHDGLLDLVVSKISRPLGVFLNDGGKRFVEVTANLFDGEPPADIEWVSLADMNNDTWLDLFVVYAQYPAPRPARIFLYDPASRRFAATADEFGVDRRSIGGVAFHDLNRDKRLDFYLSWGIDWHRPDLKYLATPFRDEFYLSAAAGGWRNAFEEVFPPDFLRHDYVGMTAGFFDVNRDGHVDFLLGNDLMDPSFFLPGTGEGFADQVEGSVAANVVHSMSWLAADFDGDGRLDLWENGISHSQTGFERAISAQGDDALSPPEGAGLVDELAHLSHAYKRVYRDRKRGKSLDIYQCEGYRHRYTKALCAELRMLQQGWEQRQIDVCREILNGATRAHCLRNLLVGGAEEDGAEAGMALARARFGSQAGSPPQQRPNVLLRNTGSAWQSHPLGTSAAYTGWSWAAVPFDVNNDGCLDLYIGTGFAYESLDADRLLIQACNSKAVRFDDLAAAWNVDQLHDARGVIIADFDNDGDGDLVVNSFMAPAAFFRNLSGGRSLSVELRSHTANYYAIGAMVELQTTLRTQVRPISHGGTWNAAAPTVAHFGLAPNEKPLRMQVFWPNGGRSETSDIEAGMHYVVYE